MRPSSACSVSTLALVLLAAPSSAATKIVDVGPGNRLVFLDEESGTDTTTISVGDTVEWRWMSSGHSTTRTVSPEGWDSGVQDAPFTFSHRFGTTGTFPYHCTPHQVFGMTGTVVVVPGGSTETTTTTLPPPECTAIEAVQRVRAAVDAECDCLGALRHRSYVRCAAKVTRRAVRTRTLPRACAGNVKRCASQSTCGRPGAVACCQTTARGVQTCSIKRSGAACRAPSRGIACVGDRVSCCDACGGAMCPAPTTTTTTATSTAPTLSTTTSTMPSVLNPCDGVGFCTGIGFCTDGFCFCLNGTPMFCSDDTPALWLGTATSVIGTVDIAFTICPSAEVISGVFFRLGSETAIFETAIVAVDGVTILFDPLIFADGSSCTFNGSLLGLTMGGDFACFDPLGFAIRTGRWGATRCP